jgi:hypothetical protein
LKALSIAFSTSFAVAAGLFGAAGLLVIASLFIADTRPETNAYLGIHLIVGGVFVALGLLLLGILLEVAAIARFALDPEGTVTSRLRDRVRRLLQLLLAAGLFLCLVMAMVTYGILARIDEGFAVFG